MPGLNKGELMEHLYCLPEPSIMSKENCEKIHNIMARVSEQDKVNIKPEPVKINQTPCPSYYEKYRIYPKTETDLLHNMVFNVCKNQQEISLMNSCIYGYCDGKTTVLL